MSYEIRNGKIQTEACELNVVHHCNFFCRACSHLSPRIEKYFVDPAQVFEDFVTLTKYYHPEHVRLLGGEPLLHPDLLSVIDAVRRSGISERIRVLTNGALLWRMPNQFWQSVDEVHISAYPSYKIAHNKLDICQEKAQVYGVNLEILHFDYFREAHSEQGTRDADLVHRIYSTCQIAQIWRCHNVCDGYFYRCPQSLFIPQGLGNDSRSNAIHDRLKITDSATFLDDLLNYLLSERPLKSCSHCLGSVGKRFPHVRGSHGVLETSYSTEELVDWEYLHLLERDPHADNLCVSS